MRHSVIKRSSAVAAAPEFVALRLLGGRGAPLSADVFTKLAANGQLSTREKALAQLGSAFTQAQSGSYAAAAATAAQVTAADLAPVAQSVRLQNLVHQLHVTSSLSKVSGAATPADVAKLHVEIHDVLNTLVRQAPNASVDGLVLASEHSLQHHDAGAAADALALATSAEAALEDLSRAFSATVHGPTPTEVEFLKRATARGATLGATGDAAKALAAISGFDAQYTSLLKTMREKYAISSTSLSDADVEALAVVAVLAAGQVSGVELVSTRFDVFQPWTSSKSHDALKAAAEITGEAVDESVVYGVHRASSAAVRNALSGSSGSILDVLGKAGGASSSTTRVNALLEQVKDRVSFNKAVASAHAGNVDAAIALFSEIERRDQFVDMWRVFLAKGQTLRTAGKLVDSDASFAKLHKLKRQRGADIPLMDEFRYKNAF